MLPDCESKHTISDITRNPYVIHYCTFQKKDKLSYTNPIDTLLTSKMKI